LILAAGVEHFGVRAAHGEARAMPRLRFLRQDVDAHALDLRRGPGEILVDDALVQPDGLEDLRAAIALHGRDAHLRHRLHDALSRRT
jgi:hypothetical protein